MRRGYIADAIRHFELGRRRVKELPDDSFTETPFDGRESWLANFQDKIRFLERARERQER